MSFRHDTRGTPNQMYLFDDGFVFTCREVRSETARFNAALLLSLDGGTFDLGAGDSHHRLAAAAVRPLLTRRLHAEGHRFVSIGLSPNHVDFRPFGVLGAPGYLGLDAAPFARWAEPLGALHAGDLSPSDARDVSDQLVREAVAQLPVPRPLDPRVAFAIERLDQDPQLPLEDLAGETGLSYDRMSHLFSESMGLPLRSYTLSLKIHTAARLVGTGLNMTDIAHAAGFSDSSHFSRVWLRAYGGTPSYFYASDHVRLQRLLGEHPNRRDPPSTQRSGAISVA